jgi:hypothetical protein
VALDDIVFRLTAVSFATRVTIVGIKGAVEGVERSPGRTEVMVDEGLSTTSYALDEALIDFGAALDDVVGTKCRLGWQAASFAAVYAFLRTAPACHDLPCLLAGLVPAYCVQLLRFAR